MIRQPIVVGYDDSPASRAALAWALRTAAGRDAEVRLVHAARMFPPILPGHGDFVAPPRELAAEAGKAVVAAGVMLAASLAPDARVSSVVLEDSPAAGLLGLLDGAEMVVVGSRGLGGFAELLVGSTSLKLATHAPCPVVVVRASGERGGLGPEAGRVVVGVDAEAAPPTEVLGFAFEEAAWRHVGLSAVHGWEEPFFDLPGKGAPIPKHIALEEFQAAQRTVLGEALAPWQEKYPGVEVRCEVLAQSPAAVLVTASTGAELVVVGSRRRGGLRALALGPVGHALLHHAHCPVAVIAHS
jgi:nucleotide-binding universal stress UspA family protein